MNQFPSLFDGRVPMGGSAQIHLHKFLELPIDTTLTQIFGFLSTWKPTAGVDFFLTWELPAGLKLAGLLLIILGGILFALGQHFGAAISQG